MSMFTVTGKVMNVFDQPGRLDKDTGEMLPDTVKLQLLGVMPVQNGQSKLDMVTLTVENKETYMKLKNQDIRIAMGFFSPAKGQVIQFVPKGSRPELVKVA